MLQQIQTVAGAGQFTGLAGAGLVQFDVQGRGGNFLPIIVNLGLRVGGTTLFDVDCYLRPRSATPPTAALEIRRGNMLGFSNIGCRLPVPIDSDDGEPWDLVLVTTGKAQDASLVVHYIYGPAVLVGG